MNASAVGILKVKCRQLNVHDRGTNRLVGRRRVFRGRVQDQQTRSLDLCHLPEQLQEPGPAFTIRRKLGRNIGKLLERPLPFGLGSRQCGIEFGSGQLKGPAMRIHKPGQHNVTIALMVLFGSADDNFGAGGCGLPDEDPTIVGNVHVLSDQLAIAPCKVQPLHRFVDQFGGGPELGGRDQRACPVLQPLQTVGLQRHLAFKESYENIPVFLPLGRGDKLCQGAKAPAGAPAG